MFASYRPTSRIGRALLIPVALAIGVVGSVNLALNLGLPGVINDKPDRVHVSWALALTLYPGHVRVWGLQIDGTGRSDRWTLALPYASGTIDLGELRNRTFRATDLATSGGRFEYALRDDPEPDRPRSPQGPWTIELPGLTAHGLSRIAVGPYAFDGDADLTGTLVLADDVDADLTLDFQDGTLANATKPMASSVHGTASATLVDLPRNGPIGKDSLERMEASTTLHLTADDLGALEVYLSKAPWLRIEGTADVDLTAILASGVLAPGSHAEAVTDDLIVRFRSYRIRGDGTLTVNVEGTPEGPHTTGLAHLGRFDILDGAGTALVRGEGFGVTANAGAIAVASPSDDLRLRLDLPKSALLNPHAWVDLFPTGSGIDLLSGTGTVHGRLDADVGANTANGSLQLEADELEVAFDKIRMLTDLTVEVAMPAADLDQGSYTLSGSQVAVRNFGFLNQPDDPGRDWWATLALKRGLATVGAATYFDSDFSLDCASSGPLFTVATERAKVPALVENLFQVRDLRGSTGIQLRQDAIVVRDLVLEGGSAEVRMDLFRRGKANRGAVFARLGPLSLGVGFAPEGQTWHPLNARSWFASQDVLPDEG